MTSIVVRTQFEGVHCWPQAKDFLASPHRHIFHIELEIEVKHDDRELEFIAVKRSLNEWIRGGDDDVDMGSTSCEMVASEIINWVKENYGDRNCICGVYEDGENGAKVYS